MTTAAVQEISPTQARRIEVLRAVSDLIANHGIDGMSMRQVADAVGMSTGTINYHFKNKRGLIMAALDFVYAGPHQDWVHYRHLPAIEQIRRRAGIFVLQTDAKRRWGRFLLEYAAHAGRDPDLLHSHQETYVHQREIFLETLAKGQDSGEIGSDVSLEDVADTLLGLIEGLTTHQIIASDSVSPSRAEHLLNAYIDTLAR